MAFSWLCVMASPPSAGAEAMPKDFVYLADIDPTIQQDMRYAGATNFTGNPVPGYDAPECVLVRPAAEALKRVQTEVRTKGSRSKSMTATGRRARWRLRAIGQRSRTIRRRRSVYYPNLPKSALFPDYIATRSGHSRGATIDLTFVPLSPNEATAPQSGGCLHRAAEWSEAPDGSLAMGTSFDCFDVKANTAARA